MDVTSHHSVRDRGGRGRATRSGPVAILVNNAGTDEFGFFKDTDEELWTRVVDINLIGVLRATHAVLPGMIEQGGGRIVNVASEAGPRRLERLGRVLGRQGRRDRLHEDDRARGRALRRAVQRGRAGADRHAAAEPRDRELRAARRQGRRDDGRLHRAAPHGHAGGGRGRDRVPLLGRRLVRDGPDARRERRPCA